MTVQCTLVPSREHTMNDHPENSARFAKLGNLKKLRFREPVSWLDAEPASMADLMRVHDPAFLKELKEESARGPAVIDPAPTYVTRGSWEAALMAAGGAVACTRAVLEGSASSAFAIVRPPGHHAEPDRAMGFCLLNNIAVAVRSAMEQGISSVLIVDFDAHHGNGTQAAFLHEGRVAFISTHQGGIYPGSGKLEDAPHARGRIVNLPLPAYAGDGVYAQVMSQVILPMAERVRPEMVFISAGFDVHWDDPITALGLSITGIFHLCQGLVFLAQQLCQGKIVFVLEGGYDPDTLYEGSRAVLAALANEGKTPDSSGPSPFPEPDVSLLLSYARELHRL